MIAIMPISAASVGVLATGVKAFKTRQKKKQTPWTYYAEMGGIYIPKKRRDAMSVDAPLEKVKALLPTDSVRDLLVVRDK